MLIIGDGYGNGYGNGCNLSKPDTHDSKFEFGGGYDVRR